ncbi:MAG: hypothetical protein IJ608_09110 [Lachnospiraceae bacterium]|nr:hypothetical protein [Lachnospiraceae bacterium]
MNRNTMPLLLVLISGLATLIVTFFSEYELVARLLILFVVMLIFYILGSIIKFMLDRFDIENEKRLMEEGDVIDKESGESVGGMGDSEGSVSETEAEPTGTPENGTTEE